MIEEISYDPDVLPRLYFWMDESGTGTRARRCPLMNGRWPLTAFVTLHGRSNSTSSLTTFAGPTGCQPHASCKRRSVSTTAMLPAPCRRLLACRRHNRGAGQDSRHGPFSPVQCHRCEISSAAARSWDPGCVAGASGRV